MKRSSVVAALLAFVALPAVVALAGCGSAQPASHASSPRPVSHAGSSLPASHAGSSLPARDLPPSWVQSEALWQSLAAGEPHPQSCQWLETSPARAARLAGSATSYLGVLRSVGKVYAVVVRGHFAPQAGQSASARSLYLIMTADHSYLAHGLTTATIDLSRLGRFRSYVPELPVHGGVWGHTMVEGGPFPGGPRPITQAQVAIWKGDHVPAAGQPLLRLRSDADGFFIVPVAPGRYTLALVGSDLGRPAPCALTVVAGRPAAAGLSVDVP